MTPERERELKDLMNEELEGLQMYFLPCWDYLLDHDMTTDELEYMSKKYVLEMVKK